MTGIILAGGEGKRLGKDKALIKLNSELLVKRILSILRESFEEVLIITSEEKLKIFERNLSGLNVKICPDIYNKKGALGGIHTGLNFSSNFHSFFVGCDTPFLNFHLIEYFKEISDGNDVVVAKFNSKFETLHAVYSKKCIVYIEELIKKDNLRIFDFYDKVKLRIVDEIEVRRYDPKKLSFFNINTKEDLKKAIMIYRLLKKERFKQ
ncbi:MAG: molybdenum cofactor guanylyltransferase [Candidatus Aminicenantia bacterium]